MSILPQPNRLKQLGRQLLSTVLPGSCLLCGSDARHAALCANCEADLPVLSVLRCPQCATPTTQGETCGRCLKKAPSFDACLALFLYDFPADRIIHALKYGHQLAVVGWLAERMATRLGGHSFTRIVPLPLHPERLRERGFNQSMEIARYLGRRLSIPVDYENVMRTRATPPQTALPLKDRHKNVRGAFESRQDFSGQHILLVDDVMTTGATLSECARILKLHGAARVTVAVAARALRQ